jgi:hypothetical protein
MIEAIKEAVEEITGIPFERFTAPGKKRERYFARLIFVHYAMDHTRLDYRILAKMVNRSPSLVFKYPQFYRTEKKFNPEFKKLTLKVEENLLKVYQSDTLTV